VHCVCVNRHHDPDEHDHLEQEDPVPRRTTRGGGSSDHFLSCIYIHDRLRLDIDMYILGLSLASTCLTAMSALLTRLFLPLSLSGPVWLHRVCGGGEPPELGPGAPRHAPRVLQLHLQPRPALVREFEIQKCAFEIKKV
jgi:hypothetical protein